MDLSQGEFHNDNERVHVASLKAKFKVLKYHDVGKERTCIPGVGQWNMTGKKFILFFLSSRARLRHCDFRCLLRSLLQHGFIPCAVAAGQSSLVSHRYSRILQGTSHDLVIG